MRPAQAPDAHGADVYDALGRVQECLDFSSTVPGLPPPSGWRARGRRALDALRRYPRPHSRGLDGFLARSLRLPAGSVLVSNGASEALDCCARLARGREVRLLTPCFGEYRVGLERAGARVDEHWWDGGRPLDPAQVVRGLGKGAWVWLANPGNPLGQVLGNRDLRALASRCRRRGVGLLVDEALRAQRLDQAEDAVELLRAGPPLVLVRSLGKGLGLPGLRLGYLAADPERVAALRAFQAPWSVNGLAQELGAWAFAEEVRTAPRRRRLLAGRAADLSKRLRGLGLALRSPGATGYLCADLGAPEATAVAGELKARGLLVRDASSFGARSRSWLRLNPGTPAENRSLALGLAAILGGGGA